jgi:hypothetical protein
MDFNVDTVGDSLPRFLELVTSKDDLAAWYEHVGIDKDVLYALAGIQASKCKSKEAAFVLGAVIAWGAAQQQ